MLLTAEIRTLGHVIALRRDVREALRDWAEKDREEILLALTELGTNIVRHAGRGVLEVRVPEKGEGPGCVRLMSRNAAGAGPERDLAAAGPGLGQGLEALGRLMDRVEVVRGKEFTVMCEKRPGRRPGGGGVHVP